MPAPKSKAAGNGGPLGIEAELFKAADKLRGNMEPSDYKHVALGLIFLKHISDSFEAMRPTLLDDYPEGAEDPDEYAAENVFWVPKSARWSHLKDTAKQPGIGKRIDEAMLAIEKENESLKGVLPKEYARPALSAVMLGELAVYGQESNYTTWRLCKMNLAVRGIDADIRWNAEGSFHKDELADLRADFILANPPFNISDWGGDRLREDARWRFGPPPAGNANYAWLQHILHHLSPNGTAGVVLANGSMSSQQSGEGAIRKAMVEADVMDCMIALPGQLFYSTQIPACLWFLARNKANGGLRDRRGEVLFIDARKLGHLVDRTRRELSDEDIARIADTYHAWRGTAAAAADCAVGRVSAPARNPTTPADTPDAADVGLRSANPTYEDIPGFCKSATLDEIRGHDHVLTPGRYVGAAAVEDDGGPFPERFAQLKAKLDEQLAEGEELGALIRAKLDRVMVDG